MCLKSKRIVYLVVVLLFLISCPVCKRDNDDNRYFDLYVDIVNGADQPGNGTKEEPLKTLSYALQVVQDEQLTIRVQPGNYTSENGEEFPIVINKNIYIQGNSDLKGDGNDPVYISGTGLYESKSMKQNIFVAIVIEDSAHISLSGLKISAYNENAVWCEQCGYLTEINYNTIVDSYNGIVLSRAGYPDINNNVIQNNNNGITLLQGATAYITRNEISGNNTGISVNQNSNPEIGIASFPGENSLTQNSACDLLNNTQNNIFAIGNIWDEDQYLFAASSLCSGGANIVNQAGGAVHYQYLPSGAYTVFNSTESINILTPENNSTIYTTQPLFQWEQIESSLVFIGVFQKPIQNPNGTGITNPEDLVWVWHSGMPRGRQGYVSYHDGVTVPNGDPETATFPPGTLERGRAYFWAMWAWNSDGTKIKYSSLEHVFIIAN